MAQWVWAFMSVFLIDHMSFIQTCVYWGLYVCMCVHIHTQTRMQDIQDHPDGPIWMTTLGVCMHIYEIDPKKTSLKFSLVFIT